MTWFPMLRTHTNTWNMIQGAYTRRGEAETGELPEAQFPKCLMQAAVNSTKWPCLLQGERWKSTTKVVLRPPQTWKCCGMCVPTVIHMNTQTYMYNSNSITQNIFTAASWTVMLDSQVVLEMNTIPSYVNSIELHVWVGGWCLSCSTTPRESGLLACLGYQRGQGKTNL